MRLSENEMYGKHGLTIEHVLEETQLQFYVAEALRCLFIAHSDKVTATQHRLNYHQAKRFVTGALKHPVLERTTLPKPTLDRWQSLMAFRDEIILRYNFPQKIQCALNELFGDLHRGAISDATLLKLETAIDFCLAGQTDKEFLLAIHKISYDHGQYDKRAYEIECRTVEERGGW